MTAPATGPWSTGDRPRAAYVHVPFCARRCGYCNFTVVAGRLDLVGNYLRAIDRELSEYGEPAPIDTLFFGGGTPTQLAAPDLAALGRRVVAAFPLRAGYEWSLEANPLDLDPGRLSVLAELGVNRISLGAQSLRTDKLRVLERDHLPADVGQAVGGVRKALPGSRLSLDLIFGAPGETLSAWLSDLEAALALEPDHLSTYGLTFERGTTFWGRRLRGELAPLGEELEREMYLAAVERLTALGWEHYEVSNFARPGARCRHNEVYWDAREYFAVGPGAARYVAGERQVNHRSTSTYLARTLAGQSPVAERERLGAQDRAREALVLGLRRLAGIDEATFTARFGYTPATLGGPALDQFLDQGLLERCAGSLRLTRAGLVVSDALWPAFLRC